jgi:hypothetical protein
MDQFGVVRRRRWLCDLGDPALETFATTSSLELSMQRTLIFWPMTAQVVLTAIVAVRMYYARIAELRRRRIHPQTLATSRAAVTLEDVAAADNFRNLFEIPVLFYAICPVLYVTNQVTALQLTLAWGFVALRIFHSLIHITYNRVMHRFRMFVLSMLCVFAMWTIFAIHLLSYQSE